jgi:hypothetical protein
MPRVRQLPEIYLRGSLANETMKHLNDSQKQEIDKVCTRIAAHPELQGHRHKFVEKLGVTIGGDYYDDRHNAQQEYQIAIWRATVHLLHHRTYSYICDHCGKCSYMSKGRDKQIVFNRRFDICPNCNHVKITAKGDSKLKIGTFIDHDELLLLIDDLEGKEPPTTASCHSSISGLPKVDNPYDIINDNSQVKKYFGQWVWNYFRQIILENEIISHGKRPQTLAGPADHITANAVLALLKLHGVDHSYDPGKNGDYHIDCNAYVSPIMFTEQLCVTLDTVRRNGVKVMVDHKKIEVRNMIGNSPFIEIESSINETVLVAGKQCVSKNDENGTVLDPVNNLKKEDDIRLRGTMDDLDKLERDEQLQLIRASLPEGDCRKVFDIYVGSSPIYDEFAQFDERAVQNSNGMPRRNKIAEFLDTTANDIKRHHESIKIHVCASDLI